MSCCFASQGQATTAWGLDAYRGFTRSKTYAGNVAGPAYDYTAAGRLLTRTWARGIGTWYTNNIAGDLAGVGYTGSASTPNVAYTLDHRGRPQQINSGSPYGATRVWDDASRLLAEIYTAGPLAGLTVSNVYDPLGRRTTNGLLNGSTWLAQTLFAYDGASRLAAVTNGVYSTAYNYLPNSPLVEQIVFRSNAVTVMTTTNQYDNLGRLTKKDTWAGGTLVARAAYGYNAANQRTNVTNADGAFWLYGYDGLGQVTSGKKYWPDGTPVLREQFDYNFDDIGNRKVAVTGGDQWGMNKRYQNYAANLLNQYTNRTVPGFMDILGAAHSNATVTLWTANSGAQPAQPGDPQGFFRTVRKGEYFRGELAANTSTGAVWLTVTNFAVLRQGTNQDVTTNMTGNVFLPKTPEAYAHDADGNLTNDGRWGLTWDGENRLVSMESRSDAPAGSKRRLTFQYDPKGRRILKAVQTWTNSAWSIVLSNAFVYDGWNLLAELNATNKAVIRSYVWGLDLSGSLQGAGGVGGMLALNDAGSGTHLVAYDGNGNVTALLNATNGTISAQYEYGPFGELLRTTGPMAKAAPLRFSTKYQDDETDANYYGYRYYNASLGRWPSRDPLAEQGGKNLAVFCANNAVDFLEVLGLKWKVLRKGGNRAHARPERGDTVQDLAKEIHFDDGDYREWLRPVGPTRMPDSATQPIATCAEFTIPNTVFVDVGPRISDPWYLRYLDRINATFTFMAALAQGTGDAYSKKGFNVVRTRPATGTDIRSHLASPNIHAYVFAGHGGSGAINSTELDAVFPGRYTRYGIQYMGLIACGSALDGSGERLNSYPSNVARRGIFFGSINNYTALLAIIIGADELVFIWIPGTN